LQFVKPVADMSLKGGQIPGKAEQKASHAACLNTA